MKKPDNRLALIIVLAAILLPVLVVAVPFTSMSLSMCSRPDPPMPEITRAEFPFILVYTVDGEERVYEDVMTCEFAGVGNDTSRKDKYRKWKADFGKEGSIILSEPGGGHGDTVHPPVHRRASHGRSGGF